MSSNNETDELNKIKREKEKALKKAQKLIYPVGSTRKRIAYISSVIFILFVVIFTSISASLVYIFKDTSEFTYQVNRIVPFPIGVVGSNFVTYEEYLFEYRDDEHFLREYGDHDPSSAEFKQQIKKLQTAAENRAFTNALAENLTREKGITIDQAELEARLASLKAQAQDSGDDPRAKQQTNNLRDNPRFDEIIMQYYGWTVDDLERDLRMQLLRAKLAPTIDSKTNSKAKSVRAQALAKPSNFASLAKKYSDDIKTSAAGGVIGILDNSNKHLYPNDFIKKSEALKDGQISELIQTDYGLHIIKRDGTKGGKPVISHILFQFRPPGEILDELIKSDKSVKHFVNLS